MTDPAGHTTQDFNELTDHYLRLFRSEPVDDGTFKAGAMLTAVITYLCGTNGEAVTVDTLRSFVTTIERFGILMDGEQPTFSAIN